MFPEEASGNEIILAIKDFYEHCIDVDAYNRSINRNITYVGFATINNLRDSRQVVFFHSA